MSKEDQLVGHSKSGSGSRRGPARRLLSQWDIRVWLCAVSVATAGLLAIALYVHIHDTRLHHAVATSALSEATLFRVQAAVAVAVALALLIYPHVVVWAAAGLVAGSATGAVLVYTYADVGQLGPLPDLYERTWASPERPPPRSRKGSRRCSRSSAWSWPSGPARRRGGRSEPSTVDITTPGRRPPSPVSAYRILACRGLT